mmetsp:Transcript_66997/g.112138  ORF Transcript_66997/g.112138 Transcript_66997/m.112138 type:complete len:204 (-) Transcript_66997:249-860(-)
MAGGGIRCPHCSTDQHLGAERPQLADHEAANHEKAERDHRPHGKQLALNWSVMELHPVYHGRQSHQGCGWGWNALEKLGTVDVLVQPSLRRCQRCRWLLVVPQHGSQTVLLLQLGFTLGFIQYSKIGAVRRLGSGDLVIQIESSQPEGTAANVEEEGQPDRRIGFVPHRCLGPGVTRPHQDDEGWGDTKIYQVTQRIQLCAKS